MSAVYSFAIGMGFALAVSLITIVILRPHLSRLLEELCGTQARAGFWIVVSTLSIFLLGVLAGTVNGGYPSGENLSTPQLFFGLVTQLRACLIGLLVSLLVVAWLLLGFIRRFELGLGRVVTGSGGGPAGANPA
jgi:hypothetical protein